MVGRFRMRGWFVSGAVVLLAVVESFLQPVAAADSRDPARQFNGPYAGRHLDRVAFPIGGIGAGMFCLEGSGAISHMSVRHRLEHFHEPVIFAAVCVKGADGMNNTARVLEGPLPDWKHFGRPRSSHGEGWRMGYGYPRFREAEFLARFPFATIRLADPTVPLTTQIVAWSPFTPPDADGSSLPVGAIEYGFENTSAEPQDAVFSFHAQNFMTAIKDRRALGSIDALDGGFVLYAQSGKDRDRHGAFAVFVDRDTAMVDHCWFRQSRWGKETITWRNIARGLAVDNPPVKDSAGGASLYVPFTLAPGEKKTVRLLAAWYVPETPLRFGRPGKASGEAQVKDDDLAACCEDGVCVASDLPTPSHYVPWYATKYKNVRDVAGDWRSRYDALRRQSARFCDAFYDTTLPPEVVEAVAANLTILKTPTVLRQHDGRLWCWEGCNDDAGCCPGSCTHVWNYAQAIAHLFPSLERGLRQNEFFDGQDATGAQRFRGNLPITPGKVTGIIAADGQLGGIMKAYREWRISGNRKWLAAYWPRIRKSMDFMIEKWDPRHTGLPEESHHNTYDINYFGPDGHCGSFYLGALAAAARMGREMKADVALYEELLGKGRKRMESELYNGEYFIQIINREGRGENALYANVDRESAAYRDLAREINEQGPFYQYGNGCLADGVLGLWMARMCGLDDEIVDTQKVGSHLRAVHKYNFKDDLSTHANPQRPAYAMGNEGGLLLCTWPRGDELIIPFVYSHEVWTGIEYQVASHLMLLAEVDKALEIVRACRQRYDGVRRNPFNEYECGHWYARAMSSYALIEGLTGVRYDAVTKTLSCDSKVGDFRGFLATDTGYGVVELKGKRLTLDVREGEIVVTRTDVGGREKRQSPRL